MKRNKKKVCGNFLDGITITKNSKGETRVMLDGIDIVAVARHMFYKGKYEPLIGFRTRDGRIDDTCLALLASDYLVYVKGVPHRRAHYAMTDLCNYMLKKDKFFYELTLKEYRKFGDFDEDIFALMRIPISARLSAGEFGIEDIAKRRKPKQVRKQGRGE